MKNLKHSVLATDLSKVDEHLEQWILEREKKQAIYIAIEEYILCLKNSLKNETDSHKKVEIKQEIKKQEKLKQKYYVPSILSAKLYESTDIDSKESSFKLLKKIKNKKQEKR